MLTLGIPREIKPLEKRVGMTPEGVSRLTAAGVRVFVESKAGAGSGFSDQEYALAGARMVGDAAALYGAAGLIQKVKEPLEPEYPLMREGQIIFGFFHLASPENCGLLQALLSSGVTALAYETLERDGKIPLLAPMSEIAGGLSSVYAAFFSGLNLGSAGTILYPEGFIERLEGLGNIYPDIPKGLTISKPVLIFGGGVAGQKALETALALGAKVTVVEKSGARREILKKMTPFVISPEEKTELNAAAREAKIFIGCVHVRGERAFKVMTPEELQAACLKQKKIILDISIDQGGNFPEARSTAYRDPLYRDSFGNIRFGVPNIPSFAGRAASQALTKESLPYTLALAEGLDPAFLSFPELRTALNTREGNVCLEAVAQAHRKSQEDLKNEKS